MEKAKSISLILGVLIMSIFIVYLSFAWQSPTKNPPDGNVPAPLNIGPQGQAKQGGLILNTGGASTGLIVQYGNVGIGTTATPTAKLHIRTTDSTTVPFQVEALVQGSFELPGWNYRKPITISNKTGALTDYQILVTLNTQSLISAGKMRSDCGDIRFTDSDGQSLLNYWLEAGCNTASTKIWVKVPSIPANSTKTIYVYYGNQNATSASNADNVFIFFDDFSTNPNTNDKWLIYRATLDASNEFYWDSTNKWVYLTKAVNRKGVMAFFNLQYSPYNTITEFDYLAGGGSGADGFSFYFDKDRTPYTTYGRSSDVSSMGCEARDDRGDDYLSEGYGVGFDNNWNYGEVSENHLEITKTSSKYPDISNPGAHLATYNTAITEDNIWHSAKITIGSNFVSITVDGNTLLSYTGLTPLRYNWQGFGAGTGYYENNNHIIRNVKVRQYASPEPTTSVGTEETVPPLQQRTIFYIQNQTGNVGIGTRVPSEKLTIVGNIGLRGGNRFIGTIDNYALSLKTNNSDRIYITNTGNVGIGTTNPAYKLDVSGDIRSTGYIRGGTGLCIGTDCRTSWPRGTTNYLAKFTGPTSIGNSIIYDNGTNVGIGTAAPLAKFHVKHPSTIGSEQKTIFLGSDNTANDNALRLRVWDSGRGISFADIGADCEGGTCNKTILTFSTRDNWKPLEEKMRITENGNVGIGTTAPNYKLEVAGGVGADAYYYRSDISLKENVRKIEDNILEKVLLLEPVKFNWKENGKESVGLIAQEVEKVFPEVVFTEKDGKKSIDYGKLTAILIKALKEQQNEIEILKEELKNLKGR